MSDAQPDRNRSTERRRSVVDARNDTGLERRRGPGRRRSDFMKSAEEGEMSQEQFLFIRAIDVYKRVNERPFPTWTEVLEVIRKLGYRKTCAMELELKDVDDWQEAPDADAFPVRDDRVEEQDGADDDGFEMEIPDDFFDQPDDEDLPEAA